MCLGIPAKVIGVEESMADVEVGGAIRRVNIQLISDVRVGDYVLLHAGFAIQKLDEKEAMETLKLLEELYEVR